MEAWRGRVATTTPGGPKEHPELLPEPEGWKNP